MSSFNVSSATTAELVAFFNANTGGNPVKKFADRKTAERRVQALIDEMDAETKSIADGSEYVANDDTSSVHAYTVHGHTHCPGCGIHLSNGVGADGDEVNGKAIKHNEYEYACLGCGHEFGPAVVRYTRVRGNTPVVERPAMAESLKLDRQILSVNSGIVYKNACQVWKAGLVTAAQGDRLSAVLYGEAKKGNRHASLTIGNHVFTLAVK